MEANLITSIKGKANFDLFNTVTYELYDDQVVCSSKRNGEKVVQVLPLVNLHTITSINGVNWLKIVGYSLLIFCYGLGLIFLIVYLCKAKNMITLNDRIALRYKNKEEGDLFIKAVLEQQKKVLGK